MFCKSLLLQCCLLKFVLSFPTTNFFINGNVANDHRIQVSSTEAILSFSPNIGLGCGAVSSLKVSIAGEASLSPSGQSPSLVFKVFSVSSGDIDTHEVFYRHASIDSTLKNRVKGDYSANYPREPAFDPNYLIVVTWNLSSDLDSSAGVIMKDVFQLVIANGGSRSLVYYYYNMTEWAIKGNGYASVGLKSCESTWTQTGSNTTAISSISLMQSNVDVPGKWLFLIAGDKGEIIHPVKCRAHCSLTYGFCTVANTCTCRSGWSGHNCTQAVCSPPCVNGDCNSPDNCTCQSGWSGDICNVADCPENICDKDNGVCHTPNVCTCNAGWTGSDCKSAICSPACVNGACTHPNTCHCANRWTGSICDTGICSMGCVNGTCNEPDVCTCNSGYTGDSCETKIVVDDTDSSSLSGSAIGAIVGGIVGFAILIIAIVVVVIVATVTCC